MINLLVGFLKVTIPVILGLMIIGLAIVNFPLASLFAGLGGFAYYCKKNGCPWD